MVCAQEKAALQTVSVRLQQAAFWFVGEYAPTLCAAACGGDGLAPEPDLLLRLQHGELPRRCSLRQNPRC